MPSGRVDAALEVLGCTAEVVSLDPGSLDEVIGCLVTVGKATGVEHRAQVLAEELRARLKGVEQAVTGRPRPRVVALEWADPPFNGGHWVPDMVENAGGEAVFGNRGAPSVRLAWEDIAAAVPEVVVFMPCGYGLAEAAEQAQSLGLPERAELASASAFFAVDASSSFSRPGPRLVDGVEALASALHPGTVLPPHGAIRRLR